MEGGRDISVKIAGIKFPNPLILASGIADETGLSMASAVSSGAGGVVTKSLGLYPRDGHPNPVIVDLPEGMINAMGLPNPGIDEYAEEIEIYRRETGGTNPIIASVFGSSIGEYAEASRKVADLGVDAVEINGSCPNAKGLGMEFGQDPDVIRELVEAVKDGVDVPVFFKLTPNTSDIVSLALAARDGGADGLVAINTIKAMAIDVHTARPILTNVTGGLSGPAVRSVGVRCVYEIGKCRYIDIPIIGVGGITSWEDAVEYILAGASAVQIGTAVKWHNLAVFSKVSRGIEGYMDHHGFATLEDIIGLTHRRWK
ncbi:MAG: dihydroorotate dehydrogenase [Thermoplasmatota archaeon]